MTPDTSWPVIGAILFVLAFIGAVWWR